MLREINLESVGYKSKLNEFFYDSRNVWVIHYSSSDYNVEPIQIASIAVRKLRNNQAISFSRKKDEDVIGGEKRLLKEFFNHVELHKTAKYIHWNMRNAKYGFSVIENRFKELFPNNNLEISVANNQLDLSATLVEIYGEDYIGNPRLKNIMIKNNMNINDFMEGDHEVIAFKKNEFHNILKSTLCKVNNLADIADMSYKKTLKTNNGKLKLFWNVLRNAIIRFALYLYSLGLK